MNYEFLPEARDELWEAALYYASQEEGLGVRFRQEVRTSSNAFSLTPIFGGSAPEDTGESTARSFRITSPISSEGRRC
jgi:hypothetical protein